MGRFDAYLDDETGKIATKLMKEERGLYSKIVRNALKEYAGYAPDLDSLKKKLQLLYDDRSKIDGQIFHIEQKINELKDIEVHKTEEMLLREEKEKRLAKERRETFFAFSKEVYNLDKSECVQLYKEFLNLENPKGIVEFLDNKFHKKQIKQVPLRQ